MNLPEKLLKVLKNEGVVAIVTQGVDGPHVVNTWNSYITATEDGHLLIPAGGMKATEANIGLNSKVLVTLGSREVEGFNSMGTGFLIKGSAGFVSDGPGYNKMKTRFPWLRAVLLINPLEITQTL